MSNENKNLKIILDNKKQEYRDIINDISVLNSEIDRLSEMLSMRKTELKIIEVEIKLVNNSIVCDN